MSEWKEYKLEDIAEILDHKRCPLSSMQRSKRKGAYPYYGASGIIDYIDDYIFEGEHVLISEDGENLRTRKTPIAFLADGKYWVNNHAHIIKSDSIHNKLICYYFAQLDLNPYITGAVQPKLSQESLKNIPLYLPVSKDERKEIVSILSSLDDKIDLLRRENATLEALAETLFLHYFIENTNPAWKEGKLGELMTIGSGKGLKRSDFVEKGQYPVLGANGEIGRANDYLINENDSVLYTGRVGTLGKIFRIEGERVWLSDNTLVIKPKRYFNYVYFILKQANLQDLDVGSTQPLIRQSDVVDIDVIIPNDKIIEAFEKEVCPLFEKIKSNQRQILTLSSQRDTLLPRLMFGEVKVGE